MVGGGVFSGGGSRKKMLCKGGRYMKNKNIGGMCFVTSTLSAKKASMQKMRKQCKKLPNIEKCSLARFAHSAFYKIHISGAANRHAPFEYAIYVSFSFF